MARSSLNSALYTICCRFHRPCSKCFFYCQGSSLSKPYKIRSLEDKTDINARLRLSDKTSSQFTSRKTWFLVGGGQVHGLVILPRFFLPESLPGWSSRLTQSSACPAATNTSQQVKETIAGIEDGYKYRRESKGPHCCLGGRIDPNSLPRKLFCNRMIWRKGWFEEKVEFVLFFKSSWCNSSYSPNLSDAK